jgi:uncharacterized protein (TIGR03067 family)
MKFWARRLLSVLAVLACALPALGEDAKSVFKKLDGAWTYTSPEGEENRWVFTGTTLKSQVHGGEYVSTITLDPQAKPEPTIDFKITEGPDDSKGQTALGIYKLDGDRLTLCIAMPGHSTRPTEFKRVEDETVLFDLKRAP